MQLEQLKNLTPEQLMQMILDQQAKANEASELARVNTGSIKVSQKTRAVSVYGFGSFPVTLYKSQWELLFKRIDEIKNFINENKHLLAEKPAKPAK